MSGPANVHCVESIESVKSALVMFGERVENALTLLGQEMRKMLDWLEHDRPKYWKAQIHRATDEVAEARAGLHRCLMFPIADERPSCHEERAALRRAQARLAYCEEKAEKLKHWIREVRRELLEYEGRISRLSRMVELDVPKSIGLLSKLINRLEDYQAVRAAAASGSYNDVDLAAELFAASDEDSSDEDSPDGDSPIDDTTTGDRATAARSESVARQQTPSVETDESPPAE